MSLLSKLPQGFSRSMASMASSPTNPHVLVIGGAYSGLSTIVNLLNLCKGHPQLPSPIPLPDIPHEWSEKLNIKPRITLIDQRDGFFHTMGSPLAHTARSFVSEAWRPYEEIPWLASENINVLQGTVTDVDVSNKTAKYTNATTSDQTGEELRYDYLVVATGMKRSFPVVPKKTTKLGYTQDANELIAEIEGVEKIVVVGGGAVGVEVAGEIKLQFPDKEVILVHSRSQLLNHEPLPEEFKSKALDLLQSLGVHVILGKRVTGEQSDAKSSGRKDNTTILTLSDGSTLTCGKVVSTGSPHVPATQFLPPCAVNEKGHVKISATMQMNCHLSNDATHFAIGDIVAWPGIRRVGGALIMGQCAANNILRLIATSLQHDAEATTPELAKLPPFPSMMTLAIGETAVSYREGMGMRFGEDVFQRLMGRGLGIDECVKALQLNSKSLDSIVTDNARHRKA